MLSLKEGGRELTGQGKTQNSEVLMLGLHSLPDPVKKGTGLPLREGGREKGGRKKQQIPPAVDFPQVPLSLPTQELLNKFITSAREQQVLN